MSHQHQQYMSHHLYPGIVEPPPSYSVAIAPPSEPSADIAPSQQYPSSSTTSNLNPNSNPNADHQFLPQDKFQQPIGPNNEHQHHYQQLEHQNHHSHQQPQPPFYSPPSQPPHPPTVLPPGAVPFSPLRAPPPFQSIYPPSSNMAMGAGQAIPIGGDVPGSAQIIKMIIAVPLGPHDVQLECSKCHQSVRTRVIRRPGLLTWLICGALALVGCWPCCMIPFCAQSCQDAEHFCPNCNTFIGKYSRI